MTIIPCKTAYHNTLLFGIVGKSLSIPFCGCVMLNPFNIFLTDQDFILEMNSAVGGKWWMYSKFI